MLGITMTRLIVELVYENDQWALRSHPEFEGYPPFIFDLADLLDQLESPKAEALVIDLGQTPRVDSTGLKFLLNLYQECAARDVKIFLRNPSYHLNRILQIMQLNRLFGIEHDDSQNG